MAEVEEIINIIIRIIKILIKVNLLLYDLFSIEITLALSFGSCAESTR